MAFKRGSLKSLVANKKAYFSTDYKFSKKTDFKVGDDVYVIPLGLEEGYYETMCHTIRTHVVDGQTIGYGGQSYNAVVKCEGYDEEGNRKDSLCCKLAQLEKERIPDKEDSGKRIVTFASGRVHLPVMILSNSLVEKKRSYPISKVSILNALKSEEGIKFAYLDMASSSFANDIVKAYGKVLKDEGKLDYELSEEDEEFYDEINARLVNTVIKVHGVSRPGFNAALKSYSFFPFDNAAIASQSPAGERDAIVNYKENKEIMNKVSEFLTLFNVEVDNLVQTVNEKDLQEYYNSAIGVDLRTPIKEKAVEEKIEVLEEPSKLSNEDLDFLNSATEESGKVDNWENEVSNVGSDISTDDDLSDFEFDSSDEESFFED